MEHQLISEQLARFSVWTRFEEFPEEVIRLGIHHIYDSIGCGILGAISKDSAQFESALGLCGSLNGIAPLWGKGTYCTPQSAAWANGLACHAFEMDDTNGCDHSGAVVLPAALAAVSIANSEISGKEFITAVILGYEFARRALESLGSYEEHNQAGWNSTGTCGPFGAAVAAGRILGLNVEQTQWSLGLAASFSSGLWSFIHDNSKSKKLHPGNAARGGLMAAVLASQGFTGPKRIFEDEWGSFGNTFAPKTKNNVAWLDKLGENWKICRSSIKPYPSNRSTHSSIEAVVELVAQHNINPDDIDKVIVRANPFVMEMCGLARIDPMSAAQSSIPFNVAACLINPDFGMKAFCRKERLNVRLRELMQKVEMVEDNTQKAVEEPIVTIRLLNGEEFTLRVETPSGGIEKPLSQEKLDAKFYEMVEFVYDKPTARELRDMILSLASLPSVAPLTELLARTPARKYQEDF